MYELPQNVLANVTDQARLDVLHEYTNRATGPIQELDIITELAAAEFGAPTAMISFVDTDIQWFQSRVGIDVSQTPVEQSFCAFVISQPSLEPFVILDATQDDLFKANPLVTGEPFIRFYTGVPIVVSGQKIGTLCVVDQEPRKDILPSKLKKLSQLSSLASGIIAMSLMAGRSEAYKASHEKEMIRHQLSVRASNVVSWNWDIESGAVDCDFELRKLFGIEHSNPLSADEIISHIHEEDREAVRTNLESAMKEDSDFDMEFRTASTGRWLIGQGSVFERNAERDAVTIAGVNIDITDRKKSEEKTQLLLRELNHRVKNTLAMLQSIANQTLKNSRSPEEFKRAFSGRIRSIAAAHTLLSDKEWDPIDLHKLLQDQVNVYVDDLDKQLIIQGQAVTLGPEESLALGMVLHELATNANKYGSLSFPDGHVEICIKVKQIDNVKWLNLAWRERNGPPVKAPTQTGFGSIMIKRSLDKIIGSRVELQYLPEGVEVEIHLPLR